MAEYIPRESLLEILNVELERWIDSGRTYNEDKSGAVAMKEAIHEVSVLHAADVVEVKHGRWILGHVEPGYFTPGGNRPWVCSECGQVVSWRLDKPKENFCTNCGAKMDGGKENAAD